jgi:hypothetical protein
MAEGRTAVLPEPTGAGCKAAPARAAAPLDPTKAKLAPVSLARLGRESLRLSLDAHADLRMLELWTQCPDLSSSSHRSSRRASRTAIRGARSPSGRIDGRRTQNPVVWAGCRRDGDTCRALRLSDARPQAARPFLARSSDPSGVALDRGPRGTAPGQWTQARPLTRSCEGPRGKSLPRSLPTTTSLHDSSAYSVSITRSLPFSMTIFFSMSGSSRSPSSALAARRTFSSSACRTSACTFLTSRAR